MHSIITLLFFIVFSLSSQVIAQDTIRGVVTDESGEPLIGASVLMVGTNKGTVTDIEGRFRLGIQLPEVLLRASYSGFTNLTVKYQRKDTADLVLVLAEDVVICYLDYYQTEVSLNYGFPKHYSSGGLDVHRGVIGQGTIFIKGYGGGNVNGQYFWDASLGLLHILSYPLELDLTVRYLQRDDVADPINRAYSFEARVRHKIFFKRRVYVTLGFGQAHELSIDMGIGRPRNLSFVVGLAGYMSRILFSVRYQALASYNDFTAMVEWRRFRIRPALEYRMFGEFSAASIGFKRFF